MEQGQKIAEAMATVLSVEVEIVDTQMVRVAGTGMVRNDVGIKLRRGLINKHVMQSKSPVIIKEAGYHQICSSCPLTGKCFYMSCMVYPIMVRAEVVGTLSLIAFTNKQKYTLCNNVDSLMEFVGRMADLISSKVVEEEMMLELVNITGKLETVVDSVHEAMVAVDQEGLLTHFNHSAERLLGLKRQKIIGKRAEEVLPGFPFREVLNTGVGFEAREIMINNNDKRFHFICTAKAMDSQTGVVGVVATLSDYREAQKFAYQIVSKQRVISFDDIIGTSNVLKGYYSAIHK